MSINIELRLKNLETKSAGKSGAFVVFVDDDGTARFNTGKGEEKTFKTLNDATEYLYKTYSDPAIIIWGRSWEE